MSLARNAALQSTSAQLRLGSEGHLAVLWPALKGASIPRALATRAA
jgi:hypothetical protein